MTSVYKIKCFWTTNFDTEFSDLRYFTGNCKIYDNGLLLGVVENQNSIHKKKHVLCGAKIGSRIVFYDINSFDFLSPEKYDCELESNQTYIGHSSTIGYMEIGFNAAMINIFPLIKQEENTNSIEEEIRKWAQHTDSSSRLFFKGVISSFHNFLKEQQIKNVDELFLSIHIDSYERKKS